MCVVVRVHVRALHGSLGRLEVVALLDDQPRSGRKWNDGLREAAARGMLDVTFQLVQLGADVNSATVTGRTALLGAAFATIALPLQMVSLADYVDNSWSVAQQRADKAGEQLARTLLRCAAV